MRLDWRKCGLQRFPNLPPTFFGLRARLQKLILSDLFFKGPRRLMAICLRGEKKLRVTPICPTNQKVVEKQRERKKRNSYLTSSLDKARLFKIRGLPKARVFPRNFEKKFEIFFHNIPFAQQPGPPTGSPHPLLPIRDLARFPDFAL